MSAFVEPSRRHSLPNEPHPKDAETASTCRVELLGRWNPIDLRTSSRISLPFQAPFRSYWQVLTLVAAL